MNDTNTQKVTTIHRQFSGEVVSAAASKTIRVRVETIKMHPKYRKQYVESKTYAVHDGKGAAKVGNKVLIQECRPVSRTKRWRLIQIVK